MIRELRVSLVVALLIASTVVLVPAQTRTRRSTPQRRRTPAVMHSTNPSVIGHYEMGNEAAKSGKYDAAIAAYDEGLVLARDEPALLVNKAIALIDRGEARFNSFLKNKKASLKTAAGKDWSEAADTARKATDALKSVTPDASRPADQLNEMKLTALSVTATAMRLVASKVDQSRAETACAAFEEYLAAETDVDEKNRAKLEAAEIKLAANKRCGN